MCVCVCYIMVQNCQWPAPPNGVQYHLEGPYADFLNDCKDIYDRVVFKDIHALPDEWDIVTERYY